jgi:hypothetical protein
MMRLRSLLTLRVLLAALAVSLIVSGALVFKYARERTAAIAYVRELDEAIGSYIEFAPLPHWWPAAVPVPEWMRSVREVVIGLADGHVMWFLPEEAKQPYSVAPLVPLHELESLTVVNIDDDGLRPIGRLKNLKELTLTFGNLTDSGISVLRECRRLQSLYLPGVPSRITDAGLEALDGLPLVDCQLRGAGITGPGLRYLAHSPLWTLDLNDTAVTDAGLSELAALGLTRLSLEGSAVTDDGLSALSELPLEFLELSKTRVSPRGVPAIRAIKTLKHVTVGGPHFTLEQFLDLPEHDGPEFGWR